MDNPSNKSKLSVRYEPMDGQFFDVKPPSNSDWQQRDGKPPASGNFSRFFFSAFAVFIVFSSLAVFNNGSELWSENKNIAYAGMDQFKSGIEALVNQDFDQAKTLFFQSETAFQEVSGNLRYLTNQANRYLSSNLYLDTAEKLIESGVKVATIGTTLSQIANEVQAIPQVVVQQNVTGDSSIKLTDLISSQHDRLKSLVLETKLLQQDLTTLNTSVLPSELQKAIAQAQQKLGVLLAALRDVDQHFNTALVLLGDEHPHRYLVLLQNNHEIRATGGFIGSYAIIDVNDGEITKLEVEDIYRRDGQLTQFVPAPPGIDQVADRLHMRDANYSPDFATAAQQLLWFLEASKGPSADTVIAIDQTVAESLLRWTGPIKVKDLPETIRASNFNDVFSFFIEAKHSNTNTPKQLLIDFIPEFKQKLLSQTNVASLIDVFAELANARHIQMYSHSPSVQALAERLNLDGKMIATLENVDFLAIVSTSIGGNKSDAYIKTNVQHHTQVATNGQIIDHLTIEKKHTWSEADFANWKKLIRKYGTGKLHEKTLRFIHGKGENMDFMRIYVPKGSQLIGLEGIELAEFDSFEDLGYTVFAIPFGPLAPGGNKTIAISYKLPHQLSFEPGDVYRFVAQKQAGVEQVNFKKSLETTDALQVVQSYPVAASSAFTLYPQYEKAFTENMMFLSAIAPL